MTQPAGTASRVPAWFKIAAGAAIAAWLFVTLGVPLSGGWLRAWSPLAERLLVGALAFLVNLLVLGWCWGVGGTRLGTPGSRPGVRAASVFLAIALSMSTGIRYARDRIAYVDPPRPWCDALLVACGLAGAIVGALLATLTGAPREPSSRMPDSM